MLATRVMLCSCFVLVLKAATEAWREPDSLAVDERNRPHQVRQEVQCRRTGSERTLTCPSSPPGAKNFGQSGSPETGQRMISPTRSRTGSTGTVLAAISVSAAAT